MLQHAKTSSQIIWNALPFNAYHRLVLFFLFVDISNIFQDILNSILDI